MSSNQQAASSRAGLGAESVVRTCVGALLVAAAVLKAQQLATSPVLENDIFSSRPLLVLWIQVELFLGTWLLSGLNRFATWVLAVTAFIMFTGVTFYRALADEPSCGCFGRLRVSPWITLCLDVLVIAALLALGRRMRQRHPVARYRTRLLAVILVSLAVGVPSAYFAARYVPARLSLDGSIMGDDRFVVLDPGTWTGQPLPLLRYLDIGSQLAQGDWTVVLFHHDCPHCRKLLPNYDKTLAADGKSRLAFVELPPFAAPGKGPLPARTTGLVGRISEAREWFVETPTVLHICNGVVTSSELRPGEPKALANIPSRHQPPKVTVKVPVALDERETVCDLGFVELDSGRCVDFELINPASAIRFRSVLSECKCLTVFDPPSLAPAGASTSILVEFAAPKEPASYSQRVLIVTDDPRHKQIVLRVMARAGLPLEVVPATLDLGTLVQGEVRQIPVSVVNNGNQPVRPAYCTSSSPDCVAQVPRAVIAPRGRLTIPVVVKGSVPTGTATRQRLSLSSDCAQQPTVSLEVLYTVMDKYSIFPGILDLGAVEPGSSCTMEIAVNSSVPQDAFVKSAACVDGDLHATFVTRYMRQRASVEVKFSPLPAVGPISGAIRLQLAGHDRPVDVQVVGRVESSGSAAMNERTSP